eukprot:scaffold22815_cov61-Cyclotella_meneghiniana.AAC.4
MDRRSRSRSPSPSNNPRRDASKRNGEIIDRERLERERRERMARLRSENEAEERGISMLSGEEEATSAIAAVAEMGKKRHRGKRSKTSGDDESDEEDDEEKQQMMQLMGFGGFGTTKGKAVTDNQLSAARGAASKNKGRKYRQYMNRKGGFNRPLDKMT